jgi:hypothetical protein
MGGVENVKSDQIISCGDLITPAKNVSPHFSGYDFETQINGAGSTGINGERVDQGGFYFAFLLGKIARIKLSSPTTIIASMNGITQPAAQSACNQS